ncbi:hypothetical protein [Methanoregula sp.]
MTVLCTKCSERQAMEPELEIWTRQYPELMGLCIYCVAEWQLEHEGDGS